MLSYKRILMGVYGVSCGSAGVAPLSVAEGAWIPQPLGSVYRTPAGVSIISFVACDSPVFNIYVKSSSRHRNGQQFSLVKDTLPLSSHKVALGLLQVTCCILRRAKKIDSVLPELTRASTRTSWRLETRCLRVF